MRIRPKVLLLIAFVVAASLAMATYGLFHGSFDHGTFEIKHTQWFSSNQVAVVAERSDKEALGGLEFYVLIGNHLFTPAEIRQKYHSDSVILSSACDCLVLHWDGPNRLVVRYEGSDLLKKFVTVQRRQIGNIAISYENIDSRY